MMTTMNFCIVILLIVLCSCSASPSVQVWPNVGTVLFTKSDVMKKHWRRTDVALLQARKHCQNILPPPAMIQPGIDYVDSLLDYFRYTFTVILKESDPLDSRIMITALADAIGGYLKAWILPLTKYSFYSGIMPKENAMKIINLYKDVKKFLHTDGCTWHGPNAHVIKVISSIVPTPDFSRSARLLQRSFTNNPCEDFIFFEKSPTGFTLPMPIIDWNERTMFMPLKNEVIIHLDSQEHANSLLNYYDIAKNCLIQTNPNATYEFELRFQRWLKKDVLPHLSDDNFYVIFGNVLSLLKRSGDFSDLYPSDFYKVQPKRVWHCIECLWQNLIVKVCVIGFIVIIEVIWCIAALRHVFKKKKKKKYKNICFNEDPQKGKQGRNFPNKNNVMDNICLVFKSLLKGNQMTESPITSEIIFSNEPSDVIRFHQRPRHKKQDVGIQQPTSNMSLLYSVGTNTRSIEVIEIVNENIKPKKHSSKNVTKSKHGRKSHDEKLCIKNVPKCPPQPQVQVSSTEQTHRKLISVFKRCHKNVERAIITSQETKTLYERQGNFESGVTVGLISSVDVCGNPRACGKICHGCNCGIEGCIDVAVDKSSKSDIMTIVPHLDSSSVDTSDYARKECKCPRKTMPITISALQTFFPQRSNIGPTLTYESMGLPFNDEQKSETFSSAILPIEEVKKHTGSEIENEQAYSRDSKKNFEVKQKDCKKSFHKASSHKGYVEIKIDKPETEISVGISGLWKSPKKESKIPKLKDYSPTPIPTPQLTTSTMRFNSMIPQLRRRPQDDIFVNPIQTSTRDSKFNLTL